MKIETRIAVLVEEGLKFTSYFDITRIQTFEDYFGELVVELRYILFQIRNQYYRRVALQLLI